MERLTYYDEVSDCYKIYPDAPQGQVIQRLGKYEGREEIKLKVLKKICIDKIKELETDLDNGLLAEYKGYLETRKNVYEDIVRDIEEVLNE